MTILELTSNYEIQFLIAYGNCACSIFTTVFGLAFASNKVDFSYLNEQKGMGGLNTAIANNEDLPESVDGICGGAFYGCSSLSSFNIPSTVFSAGDSAFEGCSSLTSITIPANLHNLGNSLFKDCTQLSSVIFEDSSSSGVPSIPGGCFQNCTSLLSISIPDSALMVGSCAFQGCSSLSSISLPDNLSQVYNSAFDGCSSLSFNNIDGSYYLGNASNPVVYLHRARQDITSYYISSATKAISTNAFRDCTQLTSLRIPSNIYEFETNAIHGCSQLSYIVTNTTTIIHGSFNTSACPNLTSIFFYGDHSGYWEQIFPVVH